jgi:nucleoside diphosphate kinase
MNHTEVATLAPPRTHRRSPSRYGSDTYFLETCDALERLSIDPDEFGCRTALLLLKPDAAVTGGMRRAVTWLTEHGYRIVGAHAVALTHLHLRALWYFNWHCATPERRRLADQLAGLSASIVLVVTHPDDSVPASVRLTADKGPADPAQRAPGQLRYALAAGTYLLNQVHSPDDPDDVLRELSIYFADPELSEVIAACAAGADASADAVRLADRIESGVERRSGDLAVTHDMVWQHLRAFGATVMPRTGQEWVAAIDQADRHHVPVDLWFRIVLESAYLPMHRQTKQREL